jgi:hypothetical protein
MEAAEVMSLAEGYAIVFSRELRHVVHDSRNCVLTPNWQTCRHRRAFFRPN